MPQADNPSEYDSMPDLNQIQLASGVTALAQGAATGVRGCKVVRLLDRIRRQSWCLIHSSSITGRRRRGDQLKGGQAAGVLPVLERPPAWRRQVGDHVIAHVT